MHLSGNALGALEPKRRITRSPAAQAAKGKLHGRHTITSRAAAKHRFNLRKSLVLPRGIPRCHPPHGELATCPHGPSNRTHAAIPRSGLIFQGVLSHRHQPTTTSSLLKSPFVSVLAPDPSTTSCGRRRHSSLHAPAPSLSRPGPPLWSSSPPAPMWVRPPVCCCDDHSSPRRIVNHAILHELWLGRLRHDHGRCPRVRACLVRARQAMVLSTARGDRRRAAVLPPCGAVPADGAVHPWGDDGATSRRRQWRCCHFH